MFRIGKADFILNPVVKNNSNIYIYKYIVYKHLRVAEHSGMFRKTLGVRFTRTGEAV